MLCSPTAEMERIIARNRSGPCASRGHRRQGSTNIAWSGVGEHFILLQAEATKSIQALGSKQLKRALLTLAGLADDRRGASSWAAGSHLRREALLLRQHPDWSPFFFNLDKFKSGQAGRCCPSYQVLWISGLNISVHFRRNHYTNVDSIIDNTS